MTDDKNFDPWSAPKDNSKKKPQNSGSSGGGTGGGNGKRPEPDMDEIFRKFQQTKDRVFGGGNSGKPPRGIFFFVGAAFVIWLLANCIYTVSSSERGVVLRFGEPDRVVTEGLNFKLPYPIERVYIRNVAIINEARVGFNKANEEGLMVTGDENIVDTEFTIQWKIKDLEKFLFDVRDAEFTVTNAAESAMREIIGNMPIATALGGDSGRTKIEAELFELLQEMLDSYSTGIEIVGIQLNKIDVPPQVVDAQIDVQNAKTEQERVKNEAEAYSNDIIPRARGEAAKMIQDAEAYKAAVLSKAKGDTSRFLAVYKQYALSKDVTKKRIYLETMQEVMKGMDKIILDDEGKVMPYLPINPSKGGKNAQN